MERKLEEAEIMNKDGEKAHKNNNTPDTTFSCEPVSSVLCFLNTSVSSRLKRHPQYTS